MNVKDNSATKLAEILGASPKRSADILGILVVRTTTKFHHFSGGPMAVHTEDGKDAEMTILGLTACEEHRCSEKN